jgi:hypothetical protein
MVATDGLARRLYAGNPDQSNRRIAIASDGAPRHGLTQTCTFVTYPRAAGGYRRHADCSKAQDSKRLAEKGAGNDSVGA